MNRVQFPLSSKLGTLLPLCLLWGFIACVLLCLHHDEDSHDMVAVEALDSGCGEDVCPVTDDTEFVTPGRQLSIPPAGEGWRACPAAAQAPDGVYASAPPIELEATPTPSLGPPPERRCVLRI